MGNGKKSIAVYIFRKKKKKRKKMGYKDIARISLLCSAVRDSTIAIVLVALLVNRQLELMMPVELEYLYGGLLLQFVIVGLQLSDDATSLE